MASAIYVLAFVLLFTLVNSDIKSPRRFWYSTKHTINQSFPVDFRGCYDTECAYISRIPLFNKDHVIGYYDEKSNRKLWAMSHVDSHTKKSSISWVFSPERPDEISSTAWITPVSRNHVSQGNFDPTPYLKRSAPDPLVEKFVGTISQARIQARVEQLATDFHTRNSISSDAVRAAQYLRNLMETAGCTNARLHNFRNGYSPNVLCEIPGDDPSAPAVFVGAHYDCRSTGLNDPNQRAPGADDNGSGSAGLLDILISALDLRGTDGISFRRTIMFGLFSGEEQGLIGSGVYASQLRGDGVQLLGMVGLDMIGYPQPNAPTTLYWMSVSTNQNLTSLGIALTQEYVGGTVAPTRACCSDQQSFHSQGFPAAAVAESLSYSNNPNYHRSTDLPATLTFSHVWRTTQGAAALVATLAEPRQSTKH